MEFNNVDNGSNNHDEDIRNYGDIDPIPLFGEIMMRRDEQTTTTDDHDDDTTRFIVELLSSPFILGGSATSTSSTSGEPASVLGMFEENDDKEKANLPIPPALLLSGVPAQHHREEERKNETGLPSWQLSPSSSSYFFDGDDDVESPFVASWWPVKKQHVGKDKHQWLQRLQQQEEQIHKHHTSSSSSSSGSRSNDNLKNRQCTYYHEDTKEFHSTYMSNHLQYHPLVAGAGVYPTPNSAYYYADVGGGSYHSKQNHSCCTTKSTPAIADFSTNFSREQRNSEYGQHTSNADISAEEKETCHKKWHYSSSTKQEEYLIKEQLKFNKSGILSNSLDNMELQYKKDPCPAVSLGEHGVVGTSMSQFYVKPRNYIKYSKSWYCYSICYHTQHKKNHASAVTSDNITNRKRNLPTILSTTNKKLHFGSSSKAKIMQVLPQSENKASMSLESSFIWPQCISPHDHPPNYPAIAMKSQQQQQSPENLQQQNNQSSNQSTVFAGQTSSSETLLVLPSDRSLTTSYCFSVMEQVIPTTIDDEERKGRRCHIPANFPGIMCRYCNGQEQFFNTSIIPATSADATLPNMNKHLIPGSSSISSSSSITISSQETEMLSHSSYSNFSPPCTGVTFSRTGRYFPSSYKNFADSKKLLHAIYKHLIKCQRCPDHVKQQLICFQKQHEKEQKTLCRGNQAYFLKQIWQRLHGGENYD